MALRARWRHMLGNLALLCASLIFVLGVAEILARVDLARRRGKEERERTLYTEPDPLLGWRMRPGSRVEYHRTEYTTEVILNSLGLHDKERALSPAPGVYRILALGDSFVEAYMVDFKDSITQVLERDLDRPGRPVEVVNAGVGGYSTDQEYLYYRERGHLLSPRLVVLFFNYNDILGNTLTNYYSANKPHLELRDGSLVATNLPVQPRKPRKVRPPRPRPVERFAAWAWLKERLLRGAPRLYDSLARLGLWEPFGGKEKVNLQMKAYRRRPPEQIRAGWILTDAILAALARESAARGARLVVVYIPARFEVHDTDWDLTRMRYGLEEGRWDPKAVSERLQESGRRGSFPVLDLTPALRRAAGRLGRRTFFRYDGHWNAFGQRVSADELASYLEREGFVPPRPGSP